LELSRPGFQKESFGSFADRVSRLLLALDPDTLEKVFQSYRMRYGEGAYVYARRTVASWRVDGVRHIGQTVLRLLEFVPMYVEGETKFELVRIVREETLRRLHQVRLNLTLRADDDLTALAAQLREVVRAQIEIELPPGLLETQAWVTSGDAAVYQKMIRETERRLLTEQLADFLIRVRWLQKVRQEIRLPLRIEAVFELPTAHVTLRILKARKARMSQQEGPPSDDHGLLAMWSDLDLETRFKAGEVSYPEYVLRNMDQFFTPQEQSELHKIAAMHGLELERLLMEIQIKSRTSEADLQKLLTTLRTLQEKNITADVVSRHETPSGHIEISARSRHRALGCLPGILIVAAVVLLLVL